MNPDCKNCDVHSPCAIHSKETWQDRFDKFIEKTRDQDYDFRYGVLPHRIEAIKEFLNTEIQLALSKQREEIKNLF